MAVFDELSVNVTADTADFTAGMESVEGNLNDVSDEALQTAANMQILQGRTDEAGDEMMQLAGQSGGASLGLSKLSGSSTLANGSLSGLSTTLVLSVIPALGTLAAALVPIVTAIGGLVAVAGSLASAFGAIVGSGLIAFGEQRSEQTEQQIAQLDEEINNIQQLEEQTGKLTDEQEERLNTLQEEREALEDQTGVVGGLTTAFAELRKEVMPLIVEFGAQFIPLIEDTLNAIPAVVEEVLAAASGVSELTDGLRDIGSSIANLLPELALLVTHIATEFMPAFVALSEDILPEIPGFVITLVDTLEQLAGAFQEASNLLVELAPALLDFGFAALDVVGPALRRLVDGLTDGIQAFNNLDSSLQSLSFTLASVGPLLVPLVSIFGGPLGLAIGGIVAGIITFRKELTALATTISSTILTALTNFARDISGTITTVQTAFAGLETDISGVLDALGVAFADFTSGINLGTIRQEAIDLAQAIGTQLAATIKALGPVFANLETFLRDNQAEFRTLGQATSRVVQALLDVSTVAINTLGPVFRKVIIPAINATIDALDWLLSVLSETIQVFGKIEEGDLGGVFDEFQDLGGLVTGGATLTDDRTTQDAVSVGLEAGLTGQTVESVEQQRSTDPQRIEVTVQEGSDFVDTVVETSQGVVQGIGDRSERLGQRGG